MKFALLVYGSASHSQAPHSAYRFARQALEDGHQISRVFFYGEAVGSANELCVFPRDELNLLACWQQLAEQYSLDLVVCIAAAVRRGVIDAGEAKRHQKPAANLPSPFVLSGLGQLADAMLEADRTVTFGA